MSDQEKKKKKNKYIHFQAEKDFDSSGNVYIKSTYTTENIKTTQNKKKIWDTWINDRKFFNMINSKKTIRWNEYYI